MGVCIIVKIMSQRAFATASLQWLSSAAGKGKNPFSILESLRSFQREVQSICDEIIYYLNIRIQKAEENLGLFFSFFFFF